MARMFSADNARSVRLADIPYFSLSELRTELKERLAEDCRILAFFDIRKVAGITQCLIVLADPRERKLRMGMTAMQESYPAMTPEIPAMHYFEREIYENTGIRPEGHPWLKPVRFSAPGAVCGVTDYYRLTGTAAHEVAVGPVHAGVIEPGHFRFQCLGEDVEHLEIELGYQHRGVEKLIRQGNPGQFMPLAETASGDSSAAAALAAARIRESVSGVACPSRGNALRRIAVELERIANHIGDLGALAGDVAYLPTASYCGRIRGDFLNMTAALCGNRFGHGYIVPGGVRYDADGSTVQDLLQRIAAGERDLRNALDLMFDEPSVLDRFENTGCVMEAAAREFGAVGMAARASGLVRDARRDLAPAAELPPDFKVCSRSGGDVLARAKLRRDELRESLKMVKYLLNNLPSGEFRTAADFAGWPPDTVCVSVAEAWRGELCHAAVSDGGGRLLRYKIVDPSFHNWFMLALALRGQQISDFPICNKSFNLSYCGHDL